MGFNGLEKSKTVRIRVTTTWRHRQPRHFHVQCSRPHLGAPGTGAPPSNTNDEGTTTTASLDLQRGYEDAKDSFDDWADEAKDRVREVGDRVRDVASKGADFADDLRERAEPLRKAIKRS